MLQTEPASSTSQIHSTNQTLRVPVLSLTVFCITATLMGVCTLLGHKRRAETALRPSHFRCDGRNAVSASGKTLAWAELALYFCHIVVKGFTYNLAILAHDNGHARNREITASSCQTREIVSMLTGRGPLNGYLIAIHNTIGDINLHTREGSHTDRFTTHDGLTPN